ncbi:MAG: hypothetical protein OEY52_06175 [Gammaproteobacteria bacterium]|nr:hypothetical protein [Gammaproteobacteria bacterium]
MCPLSRRINYLLLSSLLGLILSACGPSGDTKALKQNILQSKYNITSLAVRPVNTRTISPTTGDLYFDHNDSEQLQAIGINDSGAEFVLEDTTWGMTDVTATAGQTSISQDGLLKTETLAAANQTKTITLDLSFGTLTSSTTVVISSHTLTPPLAIKLNGTAAGASHNVTVCDTATLTTEGNFSDGSTRDVTSKIAWSSAITDSNGKISTSNPNQAIFSAHTNATYTITPNYKGQGTGTVDLVVGDTGFSNLKLDASSVSLDIDQTHILTATADINGSSTNVSTRARWVSADTTIFSVNSSGTITGVKRGGPINLTVQCGSATDTSSVTVEEDNIDYIEILNSDSIAITNLNLSVSSTTNLKAKLHRTDDTSEEITTDANTEWSVRDLTVGDEPVTVNNTDNKGLVTAVSSGSTEIVVKYKSKAEADIFVTVSP